MEQKKKEQDVLIVRDEKTGEISVVTGLNKDGTPKRVPAKPENSQSFLKFDKHGDMLDNFFTNFFRQCKNPSRFGFYHIAAEQAEKLVGAITEMLKKPEVYKDVLASHKVDTGKYEQQVAQEQPVQEQPKEEEAVSQEQGEGKQQAEDQPELQQEESSLEEPLQTEEHEAEEQTASQEPEETVSTETEKQTDEYGIDWNEMEERWGISRKEMDESGELKSLVERGITDLIDIRPKFGDEHFDIQARLSLKPMPDGSKSLVPHFIRKEPQLDMEYKGVVFTPEDKENLKNTGNLGRVAEVMDKETGEITPSFISIDRKTNEITDLPVKDAFIRNKIGKTPITEEENKILLSGGSVRKQVELHDGKKFTPTLQVNVEQRGIEFVPKPKQQQNKSQQQGKYEKKEGTYEKKEGTEKKEDIGKKEQTGIQAPAEKPEEKETKEKKRSTWLDKEGNIRPIKQWKESKFDEQQKADYVAGKTVVLKNTTDYEGNPCTLYIKFDWKKEKPVAHKFNPDVSQGKVVAPSNESRTQVAVNNEGKTNEATKHTGEPLKQGQVAPANEKQQERQQQGERQAAQKPDKPKKNKGVRM